MPESPIPPETVIYTNGQGRAITFADLSVVEKTPDQPQWKVSTEAQEYHAEGRRLGGEGNYELALAAFARASELAPDWPYPYYDAAFTHLLQHNWSAALENYRMTQRLYPQGFFTTFTAIDTLEREESGDLPQGVYLLYLQLEWTGNAEEKNKILELLVTRCPDFAPGWKEKAVSGENSVIQRFEFVENGLKANPDPETLSVLLINKAVLTAMSGEKNAAIKILGETLLDGRTTQSNRILARMAMKSVLGLL